MARTIDPDPDPGSARERIAEILRSVMGAPEEAALEDEMRRLMLQLSIEPLDNAPAADSAPRAIARQVRRPILRRLLGKTHAPPRA